MGDLTPGADGQSPVLTAPAHRRWLEAQGQRLLDFSKAARVPDGFAALDRHGRLPADAGAETILTARMTHAYALGALQGLPGCAPLVAHGVAALLGPLRDAVHGGWHPTADAPTGRKLAYVHAFVALGASSAHVLGVEGSGTLLALATATLEERFWSESEGAMRESFAADWSEEEEYRGANSNMHAVEAALALADVLGAPVWRDRALRIVTRLIHDIARAHRYRVAEHFDRAWRLLPDYNRDKPDDDLRPFGLTPGHFLEWSHLLLKLEAARLAHGEAAPAWLFEDAAGLFEAGMATGWAADGAPGILYTIDWDDMPSMRIRPHWVLAEAVTAAATMFRRTGEPRFADWYRRLWDYADLHLIDRREGSWHNEVDATSVPSEEVYPGKADLYHAYQATLAPMLPTAPSFATALRRGLFVPA